MKEKIMEKFDNNYMKKLNHLFEQGWKELEKESAIIKVFKFKNFIEAFSWMNKVAFLSEKDNHHPEFLNVYNKVEIKLTTHDSGGLSTKDIDLAEKIESL